MKFSGSDHVARPTERGRGDPGIELPIEVLVALGVDLKPCNELCGISRMKLGPDGLVNVDGNDVRRGAVLDKGFERTVAIREEPQNQPANANTP